MRPLLIASLAAALLAGCTPKTADQPLTKVEPEFGQKVRAYLLANPEVLVEVSTALKEKQTAERLGPIRSQLERDGRDHVLNPNGKVTVVQFFDYNCGYCKVIAPQVLEMAKAHPDVRFVFKDMVIFGETSEYSAAAASLAKDSPQFIAVHRAFMTTKPLDDAAVDRILKANGMDPAQARARQAAPTRKAYLNEVHMLAQALGIEGTPAFIVGNTLIPGADARALEEAILKAKQAKGIA
ncbi:MAG: DsbA family protein [Caulobacter sp.]|jgi:protein-disulfide isomerase|nr:DsbA family protein [Caulobacter sp.]